MHTMCSFWSKLLYDVWVDSNIEGKDVFEDTCYIQTEETLLNTFETNILMA